jgi:hypothetical protein
MDGLAARSTPRASLQFLNGAPTQSRSLSKLFLCQVGAQSMRTEQLAKCRTILLQP